MEHLYITGVHLTKSIYNNVNGQLGFQAEDKEMTEGQLVYVTAQFFTLLFLTVPPHPYDSQTSVGTSSPFHVLCYNFNYSLLIRDGR